MKTSASPYVAVVDDDPSIRKALQRLIKAAGLRVLTFASAAEFLGSGDGAGAGCAIIDIHMPVMDGLELHRRMSMTLCPVPVILITAHDSPFNRETALKNGAVAYFLKPFENDELLDAILKALKTGNHAS